MRLYEVIQLLEYSTGATLNKWGERIAQAAKFNRMHLSDQFFNNFDGEMEYEGHDPEDDRDIANVVLMNLERMDPTPNKQYVMTLVRWYIGNVKKHNQLQDQYDDWRRYANVERYGEEDYADSSYPEDYYDIESIADEFDDFEDDFGNYVMNAENLDTFKIEDADQIKTALTNFERMKPQLQPNERDIGRYKTFYRFEDFVDSKMDPELKAEIENELLNRSDVKVLYNGPMGTVAIPHSHEASCELGRGTKWCTAEKNNDTWFDSYSKKNDLIIYNEKPGNAKYQFHVGIYSTEARDARDRSIPYAQLYKFENEHPVLSKILKDSRLKAIGKLANMSFAQAPDGSLGITSGTDDKIFNSMLDWNEKRGGGVMKFVDGFYTSKQSTFGLANAKQLPIQKDAKRLVRYALQRKKPWPQMEQLIIALLQKTLPKVNYSNNTHLKRLENFTKIIDGYANVLNPQWKEYRDIKAEMVAGIGAVQSQQIQNPVQKDINNSMNEMRRLINLIDYGTRGRT